MQAGLPVDVKSEDESEMASRSRSRSPVRTPPLGPSAAALRAAEQLSGVPGEDAKGTGKGKDAKGTGKGVPSNPWLRRPPLAEGKGRDKGKVAPKARPPTPRAPSFPPPAGLLAHAAAAPSTAKTPPPPPPPPPPPAGANPWLRQARPSSSLQQVVGGDPGKPAGQPVRRGGWFPKCQRLCEAILTNSPEAMTLAEEYYAGQWQV